MKPGDLVKITRRAIGVPSGTIGLITKVETAKDNQFNLIYYTVQLCGLEKTKVRRYLREDIRPV